MDKLGVLSIKYVKSVDAYNIEYEDGRAQSQYVHVDRKAITNAEI
jgi:hypothetical protein